MIKRLVNYLPRKFKRVLFPRYVAATPGEVERAEWMFYINYTCEGMVVFDVGAHIGELTLLFSKFVGGQGQVYAFEASSEGFKRLERVCDSSLRKNISLNHTALADREYTAKLYMYDHDHLSWSSLVNRPLRQYGIDVSPVGTEEISTTTIDAFCQRNEISHIDLLKIDVEGAEYQVLLGARQMLEEKRIHCCIFEFGATTFDMGNRPEDIENYLARFRYKLRNVVSGDSTFPGRFRAGTARFSMHVAKPE